MRFHSAHIDGYGRFINRELILQPGLQLIIGPNEQGKSTLRQFLIDMLYGQRRGQALKQFDESNEARKPWNGASRYGGRLIYVLDNGREMEVSRDFDKKNGTVTVFDKTHMRDITAEFKAPKNREPAFAEEHLGLSKAVFVSAATIGPMSLDDLGDKDALEQIRECIVSLADSSEETGTAERALRILNERIGEIGRQFSHSKKPLPVARFRLEALEQELAKARALAAETAALERRWKEVADAIAKLKQQKSELEAELLDIERRDNAQRLAEAERLQRMMAQATQTLFQYGALREFPLEQRDDMQRAANALAAARAQVERTRTEKAEVDAALAEETQRLDTEGAPRIADVPEATERELADLETKLVRLRERLEELENDLHSAQERFGQAQQDLQSLPDFSRLGADPVAWLTQLASSFRAARHSRAGTLAKLKRQREDVARRETAIAPVKALFAQFSDFGAEARAYEVDLRVFEERLTQTQSHIDSLDIELEEERDDLPSQKWMIALCAGAAVACAAAAIAFDIVHVFWPAGLGAVLAAVFAFRWSAARKSIADLEAEMAKAKTELAAIQHEQDSRRGRMENIIRNAGFSTLRELEALYDQYLKDNSDLEAARFAERSLAREAQEEIEHVKELFRRLQETLASIGEHIEHEDDVETAAGRTLARYQEYRDAKRRLGETRDRPAQLRQQIAALRDELEVCQREEVERALAVRQTLRDAGFREESRYTRVLAALQAYRVRTAQVREKMGRVGVLREREQALAERLTTEESELAALEAAIAGRLAAVGAETVERWFELAKQAKIYRDAKDERARLQERIDAALRGETIESLRARVEADGPGAGLLARQADVVKLDLQKCAARLEELLAEERELHVAFTERTAGQRSLNEIEEDREEWAARVADLELELEATALANAMIEESARNRHARIAPRIGGLAGDYLKRITNGAYNELMVNRELQITVRIPQTAVLEDDPKRRLSKGTVDQIYLALRLALVQSISAAGESIPLLLDDPFANYDDARLANALALLVELGKTHQILLFSCRDDIARAAQSLHVPIVKL